MEEKLISKTVHWIIIYTYNYDIYVTWVGVGDRLCVDSDQTAVLVSEMFKVN